MYSGSGLSISPIEDMANCDIDIDNSGGKVRFLRHAHAPYDYGRSLAEEFYSHPAGRFDSDGFENQICKGSDKGWNNGRFFIF